MIDIVKMKRFVPIDYNLPGRDKNYIKIINECFEYLRDINNKELMK